MNKIKLFLLLSVFVFCKENKSIIMNENETIIGILPYNGIEKSKIDSVKKGIEKFYGFKVEILPEIKAPKSAFVQIKSPRYRADSLIKFQKSIIKNYDVTHILGLCNFDISTTKPKEPFTKYHDWGIMGLAYRPGNSCIISTFRLKTDNKNLFFERFKKVTIHELGHNLDLPHCVDKKCVMTSAAESIKTIDNANLELCQKCKNKIKL
jgi:archaemetzincin